MTFSLVEQLNDFYFLQRGFSQHLQAWLYGTFAPLMTVLHHSEFYGMHQAFKAVAVIPPESLNVCHSCDKHVCLCDTHLSGFPLSSLRL